jgi:CBS domain-containing protein
VREAGQPPALDRHLAAGRRPAQVDPPHVVADAELEEVARVMTDYDLTVVPVVDARDQMIGVVTVDDVLEVVLPRGWRRRFDVLGGE